MVDASHRKLETEIKRLRSLYLTSLYAFRSSSGSITRGVMSGDYDLKNPVLLELPELGVQEVAPSGYSFRSRLTSQFPRYLRMVLFVRAISALEVFLVDVVRDIFLVRRDLFHIDSLIDLHYGEILSATSLSAIWSKIINKETRRLQNQGFKEISKFYRNRFNINFDEFSKPIQLIEEALDRRHILVHRLGKTDEEFRRRYSTKRKEVTIPEQYLLESLTTIQEFSGFIAASARQKIDQADSKQTVAMADYGARVAVEVLSDAASAAMNRDFHYSVDDTVASLGDIMASYEIEGSNQILTLKGSKNIVRAYLRILKGLARKQSIVIHDCQFLASRNNNQRRVKCNLPVELVRSIAKSLPERPWPTGVHKQIAQEFGLSNTQASAAISLILEDESFSTVNAL